MTSGKLATIFPITLATSLIKVGLSDISSVLQSSFRLIALSVVSRIVILTEFLSKPRVTISCVGSSVDLVGCTTNPKESNNMIESITFQSQALAIGFAL